MKPSRNIPDKVRRMFRLPQSRAQIESELGDEFRFHIEGRIEQFVEQGMTRADAEHEVRARFGDYETHWQQTRNIDETSMRHNSRLEFLYMLRDEIQRSARALTRSPAFSIIAVVTLALGIGATTAIFAVVDSVVLRPLPYRQANALVSILHPTSPPGSKEGKWGLSMGGYFEFRNKASTLSDIGAYRTSQFTVTNNNAADAVQVGVITSSIFSTLRARPDKGRLFVSADDVPGAPGVVVLSHEYFMRRFGGDAKIIGTNLETSSGNLEIVGVAEPGLTLPMPGPFASQANLAGFGVDVWTVLPFNPAGPFHNNHQYVGIGRLKDGVPVESAVRELNTIANRFPETLSQAYSKKFMDAYGFRTEVSALRNAVLGPTIPRALWMVMGSVLLVLLIAAANVANLFIVRMESRRREAAVRTALGASTRNMATHYLAESWILCTIASVLGFVLAVGGLRALLAIAPASIPRLHAVSISGTSAVVAVVIAATIATVLGLMPMLRRFTVSALREGGRGLSASPRQRAARNGLIVGQVALALILMAAAGLMLQSFTNLRNVKPGFDASNVTVFEMSLPFREYDTREKALTFHRELQRQLMEIPGVTSVGTISDTPLEGFNGCSVVFRENRPFPQGEPAPCVTTPLMGPGFLETLRIPVEGRVPNWWDIDERTQAVVVTKSLAERLWPGESAIGKGISTNGGPSSKEQYRVVGTVGDLRLSSLDSPPGDAVFYATTNFHPNVRDGSVNDLVYLIRTTTAPSAALMTRVNSLVTGMNSRVPVLNARSLEQVVQRSMSRTSFIMVLLGVAAGVALLLSAVGMYGVISYLVAQRRSEIGIRIALGAEVRRVAGLIMWQSVRLALAGVAIGLAAAFVLGRTMRMLLFGVQATDPLTMAAVSVLLLAVAAIASLAPSRRASRIDPLEAMRSD